MSEGSTLIGVLLLVAMLGVFFLTLVFYLGRRPKDQHERTDRRPRGSY